MTISNIFVETRLDPEISYNSQGGAGFSTTIHTTSSGREQRNINWSKARAQYDVSHAIKNKGDMDDILAMFNAMMGRAFGFRFKDWADFEIVNQNIGTGNGTQTAFQLIKTYSDPNNIRTYTRQIKKPVSGSLGVVLVGGVPNTHYTMDYTTGIITFDVAPTTGFAVVIVYCEFDVPVRFDTDVAAIRHDFHRVESWESIKLVEIKL